MSPRAAALAAAVLVAATGTSALAAPRARVKPACRIEVDPTGDTYVDQQQDTYHDLGLPYGPREDALDLTSADIASDATTVTAVFRVKDLAAAPTTAPTGTSYEFGFSTPTTGLELSAYYLRAMLPATVAPAYEVGSRTTVYVAGVPTAVVTKLGDGTGVIDVAHDEVRVSAPVALLGPSGLPRGTKVKVREVTSSRYAPTHGTYADLAGEHATYVAGTPSCVRVGK